MALTPKETVDYFTRSIPRKLNIESRHKDILVFFELYFDRNKILSILNYLESDDVNTRALGMQLIRTTATLQEKKLLANYMIYYKPMFALMNLKPVK